MHNCIFLGICEIILEMPLLCKNIILLILNGVHRKIEQKKMQGDYYTHTISNSLFFLSFYHLEVEIEFKL